MSGNTAKIYFLLGSQEPTVNIIRSLTAMPEITTRNISVVASADAPLDKLPEETVSEPDDFLAGLQRGIAAGGSVGLIAGLVAVTYPPAGVALGGAAVLSLTGMGAAVGAVTSSIVGSAVPNPDFSEHVDALKEGGILCRVDAPAALADDVVDVVKAAAPGAEIDVVSEGDENKWPI